jgi:hypothetical protein
MSLEPKKLFERLALPAFQKVSWVLIKSSAALLGFISKSELLL